MRGTWLSRARASLRRRKGVLGRVLLAAVILALSCVPAFFINNIMGYVLPLSLVALAGICCVWVEVCRRMLVVEPSITQGSAVRGEDITVVLRVANRSPLFVGRLDLTFTEADATGSVRELARERMSLLPRERRELSYQLYCAHVGSFTLATSQTRVFSPLNLLYRSLGTPFSREVQVEPYLFDVATLGVAWNEDMERDAVLTTRQSEGMDYTGVREYETGDSLRSIHWKLSARFDSQLTRLYEQSRAPGMSILCDFACGQVEEGEMPFLYDALVETLFSLERYAVLRNIDAELAFLSEGAVCSFGVHSEAGYLDIMSQMPALGQASPGEVLQLVELQRTASHGSSNIVVITACPTEELVQALAALKECGRNPVLVVVCPTSLPVPERAMTVPGLTLLTALHVPVFAIADTREFEEGDTCAL